MRSHVLPAAERSRVPSSTAAPVLLGLCLALAAAAVALDVLNRDTVVPGGTYAASASSAAGLALGVPGCLLLRRVGSHAVGWVMALGGLAWCLDGVTSGWSVYAVYTEPGLAGASVAWFFLLRVGAVLMLPLPLVLLLFPDGRLPGGRLRLPAVAALGATALLPAVLLVVPSDVVVRYHDEPLPEAVRGLALDPLSLPLPYEVWAALLTAGMAGTVTSLVVPVVVVLARFRRAGAERRAQLTWLLLAGLVAAAFLLVGQLLPVALTQVLLPVSVALVASAVVVAVTRYRLYDVDLLLGWTLLYGSLALLVVGLDVAVFALAGSVVDGRESALLATAVVAVLYGPLRARLSRLVQAAVRGRRDDPYRVVSALAERLESSSDPDAQLLAVAQSVATAFRSRYVRVELQRTSGEVDVAEHGRPVPRAIDLPVRYRGEQIGRLVLAPAAGLRLSDHDQRLLGDVVRQAATAHRTALLAEELQRSRQALVTAREEERRRLRRDLHDGLGPALGAVSLRIEAARNLARRAGAQGSAADAASADALLGETVADVAGVLDDVRRLVHGLRPPALDEVGLVGALRQQVERLRREGDAPLRVDVVPAGDLTRLPAAVEVAAYRIASEALANVVRHARAAHVEVRLAAGAELELCIRDDGRGIPPDAPAGVGLVSLRERAAELGGTADVRCPEGGGTVVTARLPLHDTVPAVPSQRGSGERVAR